MKLALIVACAENRVIGRNNELPWHLPQDLQYFKRVTMGKPIIMGRKTFESIGRPLPGRANIVVTRNPDYQAEGIEVVYNLSEALSRAAELTAAANVDEAMLIGGAELYRQGIGMADRLYLTEVNAEVEGDAYFPVFDRNAWQEVSREDFSADDKNPYNYSFLVLDPR